MRGRRLDDRHAQRLDGARQRQGLARRLARVARHEEHRETRRGREDDAEEDRSSRRPEIRCRLGGAVIARRGRNAARPRIHRGRCLEREVAVVAVLDRKRSRCRGDRRGLRPGHRRRCRLRHARRRGRRSERRSERLERARQRMIDRSRDRRPRCSHSRWDRRTRGRGRWTSRRGRRTSRRGRLARRRGPRWDHARQHRGRGRACAHRLCRRRRRLRCGRFRARQWRRLVRMDPRRGRSVGHRPVWEPPSGLSARRAAAPEFHVPVR